jgi:hypothetical protein
MTQSRLNFGSDRSTFASKSVDYDRRNLEAARIILNDRAKYDQPESRCVILWAELVIQRLGTAKERQEAA